MIRLPARRTDEIRRLVPARDDLRPLYITGHGLTVGKSGEVLQIKERGKLVHEARVNEISQVNLFGNVTLTSSALQGLILAQIRTSAWVYSLSRWTRGNLCGALLPKSDRLAILELGVLVATAAAVTVHFGAARLAGPGEPGR
jgi:hypothetical protein